MLAVEQMKTVLHHGLPLQLELTTLLYWTRGWFPCGLALSKRFSKSAKRRLLPEPRQVQLRQGAGGLDRVEVQRGGLRVGREGGRGVGRNWKGVHTHTPRWQP